MEDTLEFYHAVKYFFKSGSLNVGRKHCYQNFHRKILQYFFKRKVILVGDK